MEEEDENGFRPVVRRYWRSMTTRVKRQNLVDIVNVRLWDPEDDAFEARVGDALIEAWRDSRNQVKINASLGCLLVHKTTGEYRYFHSSSNNASIFDPPSLVRTEGEVHGFIDRVESTDLEETCIRRRPNTEWRLHAVTNITFYMYKMLGVGQLGCASPNLPEKLKRLRSVLTLVSNPKTGVAYEDNLCFFRCLAIHSDCRCAADKCVCIKASEPRVRSLLSRYCRAAGVETSTFQGVDEADLLCMEKTFDVSINVFQMECDSDVATLVWRTASKHASIMNVLLEDKHFCYVRDVKSLCNSFACPGCNACFTKLFSLQRHRCRTVEVSNMKFPGGVFSKNQTIFEKIESETGVKTPKRLRFYPYRITFDIETFLPATNLPENTSTTTYESRHELLSISICSNIPGFQKPVCFVRETTEGECVERFAAYAVRIAQEAVRIVERSFDDIFDSLETVIDERERIEVEWTDESMSNARTHRARRRCCGLENQLRDHLNAVPIVGFNSQKYDLNVIKASLVKHISRLDGEFKFVVKKCEAMSCMQSTSLRFLDICNFMAPGYTYAKYLDAFGVSQRKGFFPYEWMDSLDKLTYPSLPRREDFYSSLTQSSISENDYRLCQSAWGENNMTCMRDFLIWYNNLDVTPFLEAIQKQSDIYRERGIDMLKDAISLPGLAIEWLFSAIDNPKSIQETYQSAPVGENRVSRLRCAIRESRRVHMIDDANSDLYELFKSNIVGGPSLVFHRHHEKNVTKIRELEFGENALPCKKLLGLDANALYLLCVMGDMPVGQPIRRFPETGFRPERRLKGVGAQGWLAHVEFSTGMILETLVSGGERRLGRHNLPVDGYHLPTGTVFQFHGCYWHGHGCSEASRQDARGETAADRLRATLQRDRYISSLGYPLIAMWECEWERIVAADPEIKFFLKVFFDRVFRNKRDGMTESTILDRVRNGTLFGFVECDLTVPHDKRAYFEDNPPIFKNVDICRDDLSDHMRQFAEERGHLKRPQRSLIGSMFATKMLVFTDLLAWYLEHGLKVGKIYQVVEYDRRDLFKKFGESVSDARRAGDIDPDKTLIANTAKLVGNSVYGKTITDKMRHRNIAYTEQCKVASLRIRSCMFHSLNEMDCDDGESIFETSSYKRNVRVIPHLDQSSAFCFSQTCNSRLV